MVDLKVLMKVVKWGKKLVAAMDMMLVVLLGK